MSYPYDESFEPPPAPRNSSCITAITTVLLLLIGGAILLMLVFAFGMYTVGDNFIGRVEALFQTPQPTPMVDVRAVVIKDIQGLSELTTTKYGMQTVVAVSQDSTFGPFVIGQTKLLYVAYGEVRAGIDLSQIGPDNIDIISDTAIIRLPAPKLLDKKVDVDKSYVYDFDRGGLLAPDGIDFQTRAERQALQQIVEAACENGILDTANREAEIALRALLQASDFRSITVVPQAPPPGECSQ